MKKLLSVVAILMVAALLLPSIGEAGYRASFTCITNSDGLSKGHYSPAHRPFPRTGSGSIVSPFQERWMAILTFSGVFGSESVGEIWQYRIANQVSAVNATGNILDARRPILQDVTGVISYVDPAWSDDGKYLAYVETNNFLTESKIYVQQYNVSTSSGTAVTPVGSRILVVDGTGGIHPRHPAWAPDGKHLAFDSDASGLSIDLYTVAVDPVTQIVGVPVRHTTNDSKAEFKPDYSPDGTKLAYVTNLYGPFVIVILNLADDTFYPAETNFASVSHDNPSWSSDGLSIYYDAPRGEDPANPTDVYKLDLGPQSKCGINIDGAGDADPDVSHAANASADGPAYNQIVMVSSAFAASFGAVNIWQANYVFNCLPPLPVTVDISPSNLNVGSLGQTITATIRMPAETTAAGYMALSDQSPGALEGIKVRRTFFASPTLMGRTARDAPHGPLAGSGLPDYTDHPGSDPHLDVVWARRTFEARLVALGLVDRLVPMQLTAYSAIRGRRFVGYGYMYVSSANAAGSAVSLEQNYPNPFNPQTKINFAVSKPGNVDVRVFNVRGELVKTLTNTNYAQGMHTITWDGMTESGKKTSSGVYYIRANTPGATPSVIKAVLAQ